MYSPLGLVIIVAVEGTFVCLQTGHDHFFSNSIGVYCYCVKTELVMIRTSTSRTATRATATSKSATRESANVDSTAITSKLALLYKYKINYNA